MQMEAVPGIEPDCSYFFERRFQMRKMLSVLVCLLLVGCGAAVPRSRYDLTPDQAATFERDKAVCAAYAEETFSAWSLNIFQKQKPMIFTECMAEKGYRLAPDTFTEEQLKKI